ANETPFDIMASPASVGSTLLDAAGPTYLGPRDAIKLAFNDSGTTVQRSNLPSQSVSVTVTDPSNKAPAGIAPFTIHSVSSIGELPSLSVPNTLPSGNPLHGSTFQVKAIAVNGHLNTPAQEDYYAFTGHTNQLMTIQVISSNNTLNPQPIIPELILI